MALTLKYAKNPIWSNVEKTVINLTIRFEEIDEELPFTASPDDCEEHGKVIYNLAVNGEFGEISDFIPYVPTEEELSERIRNHRNHLLKESDWSQGADIPNEIKEKYVIYRQSLRDITKQEGFPVTVIFPTI